MVGAGVVGGRSALVVLALAGSLGCEDRPVTLADGQEVTSLTDGERAVLCDQLAAIAGGYGDAAEKQVTCEDGTIRTIRYTSDVNRAQCEYRYDNLPQECWDITVGAVKACVREFYAQTCTSVRDTTPLPACDALPDCWSGVRPG